MDERYLDMAEALAESNRTQAIAESQRAVQGAGQAECEGCGELIPPERRRAAPFAVRCISCQQAVEAHRRGTRHPFCKL